MSCQVKVAEELANPPPTKCAHDFAKLTLAGVIGVPSGCNGGIMSSARPKGFKGVGAGCPRLGSMVEGHRGLSGEVANMQMLDWEFRYEGELNGQRKQFLGF